MRYVRPIREPAGTAHFLERKAAFRQQTLGALDVALDHVAVGRAAKRFPKAPPEAPHAQLHDSCERWQAEELVQSPTRGSYTTSREAIGHRRWPQSFISGADRD